MAPPRLRVCACSLGSVLESVAHRTPPGLTRAHRRVSHFTSLRHAPNQKFLLRYEVTHRMECAKERRRAVVHGLGAFNDGALNIHGSLKKINCFS